MKLTISVCLEPSICVLTFEYTYLQVDILSLFCKAQGKENELDTGGVSLPRKPGWALSALGAETSYYLLFLAAWWWNSWVLFYAPRLPLHGVFWTAPSFPSSHCALSRDCIAGAVSAEERLDDSFSVEMMTRWTTSASNYKYEPHSDFHKRLL